MGKVKRTEPEALIKMINLQLGSVDTSEEQRADLFQLKKEVDFDIVTKAFEDADKNNKCRACNRAFAVVAIFLSVVISSCASTGEKAHDFEKNPYDFQYIGNAF